MNGSGGTNSPVRINLFGGFGLICGRTPYSLRLRRSKALLSYLALEARQITRDKALALLWNDTGVDLNKLQSRLKQVVHEAARCTADVPGRVFVSDPPDLSLAPEAVITDADALIDAIEAGGAPGPLLSGSNPFETMLDGFEDLSTDFSTWLTIKRRTYAERAIGALERRLEVHRDAPDDLIDTARCIRSLDPTHEIACRALMNGYTQKGAVARALDVYDGLWALLDEEYDGLRPSPETQEVAVRLKSSAFEAPAPVPFAHPPAPASPPPPPAQLETARLIIYVPPLRVIGDGADVERLAAGFRELFVSALVRFREWRIRDTDRRRSGPMDGAQSQYILTVALVAMGDAAQIVVSFKALSADDIVWSEQFDALSADWGNVQKKIIHRMATALNLHLSADRLSTTYHLEDFDLPAFDTWLRGQELLLSYRGDDFSRAVALFEKAVERYPRFSRAYSSLSQLENGRHLYFPGLLRHDDWHRRAFDYARQATRIDPIDSRARLALGWSQMTLGRWAHADASLNSAVELNPNDPWTIVSVALGKAFLGDREAARSLSEQALGLGFDPSPTHWGYQATLRFICGDYEACLEACDSAEGGLVFFDLPAWKAAALHHLGAGSEARAALDDFLTLVRDNWVATEAPGAGAILQWLLQCFPLRDAADLDRLRQGVIGAGLTDTPPPGAVT